MSAPATVIVSPTPNVPSVAPGTPVFGPFTPGSQTGGLQEAVRAAAGRAYVRVLAGVYAPQVPVNLPSGTTIQFEGATLQSTGPHPLLQAGGQTNIILRGSLLLQGNGQPTFALSFGRTQGVTLALDARVTGIPKTQGFVNIVSSQGVKVLGHLQSQDSRLVVVTSSSQVEISGVEVHMTQDLGVAPVAVVAIPGQTYSDVHVHDLLIDGGGVLTGPGLIVRVERGAPDAQNVVVERVYAYNTAGPGDGVDVQRVSSVRVSNCVFFRTNDGLSLVGSQATIEGIWSEDCRAEGVAVGDSNPNYMTESISGITVRRCLSIGCGTGWKGGGTPGWEIHGAGFCVPIPANYAVDQVSFVECATVHKGQQRYGIGVAPTARGVLVSQSVLQGFEAPYHSQAPQGVLQFDRVAGVPPGPAAAVQPMGIAPDQSFSNPSPGDLLVFVLAQSVGPSGTASTIASTVGGGGTPSPASEIPAAPTAPPGMMVPHVFRVPRGGTFSVQLAAARAAQGWSAVV